MRFSLASIFRVPCHHQPPPPRGWPCERSKHSDGGFADSRSRYTAFTPHLPVSVSTTDAICRCQPSVEAHISVMRPEAVP